MVKVNMQIFNLNFNQIFAQAWTEIHFSFNIFFPWVTFIYNMVFVFSAKYISKQ